MAAFRYMNKQQTKERYSDRVYERTSYVETNLDDIFRTVTQADILEASKVK